MAKRMTKSEEAVAWAKAPKSEMTTDFLSARKGLDVRQFVTSDGSKTYTAVAVCPVCGKAFGSDALMMNPTLAGRLTCGKH